MKEHVPPTTPERLPTIDDNARKFIIASLPNEFLLSHHAVSFDLIVDWIETNEAYEQKLAHKTYADGTIEIRHITKATDALGNRSSTKPVISPETYAELLREASLHLEKKRHEFSYDQDGTLFSCNYDEFTGSDLRILEVDARDEQTRLSFDSTKFPTELREVTGDIRYYGYRVTDLIS